MEKNVEKIYDDVLESLNCENDEFINSYFESDDITEEMQGNSTENNAFYDDWTDEVELEQLGIPVENFVEKDEEIPEFDIKQDEASVENNSVEFNNNDFESLLTSSKEFNDMIIEPVEEAEQQEEMTEKEMEILPEELLASEIIMEEIPEVVVEKEEFTTEDLLDLIEKTDNSEEFFEKLEDRLDD